MGYGEYYVALYGHMWLTGIRSKLPKSEDPASREGLLGLVA